jgi:hypothetical protein
MWAPNRASFTGLIAPLQGVGVLGYVHSPYPNFTIGATLMGQLTPDAKVETSLQFGTVLVAGNGQCRYKAHIDSSGKVGCHYEEFINPLCRYGLTTDIDFSKHDYKVGMSLSIGLAAGEMAMMEPQRGEGHI